MKPSIDPEEEDFFTDAPEELAENEDPLLVEQEYAGPAAALDTSMEDDKPGHVDATQEELPMPAIHDPEKDTLDNAGRFSTADTFHYKKEIWGRNKWIFLLIAVVAAAIVIYALPSMFKDYDAEIPAPASEKTGYIDVDEEVIPESLTPDLPSDGPAIQELTQEIKQQTPGETVNAEVPPEDVTEPARLPVHTKAAVNKEYYIQVGAWRNSGYAQSTLTKLKLHYPDAYIIREGSLHKIRISDIRDKQEGNRIIKDIKNKFNMNSLLIVKKK